jgi:tRNA threonylcarbamoyladenosine biosynthesis protein TsaB
VALLTIPQAAPGQPAAAVQSWVRHEATGPVSSTRVLPAVREVLQEAGMTLADCSAVAFGAGPGSFTGLRTAVGVTQGLAFGAGLPVVPVSTLMACAHAARQRDPGATRVLAVLDARMQEVYWAEFQWDAAGAEWLTLSPAALDAPHAVPAPAGRFTLAGNAAPLFAKSADAVCAALRQAAVVDPEALPHAESIAWLGWRGLLAGRAVAAAAAAPDYVRNKVALTIAERAAAAGT